MGADPTTLTPAAPDAATAWTVPWLDWLDAALHRECLRLRARAATPGGARLTVGVAGGRPPEPAAPPCPPASGALAAVRAEFGLDDAQTVTLAVALAPELDTSYRSVFAHLNDDACRPLPSLELCARLAGAGPWLRTDTPLFTEGLVQLVPAGGAAHRSAAGLLVSAAARDFLLGLPGPPVAEPAGVFDPAEHGELLRAMGTGRLPLVVIEARVRADAVATARGLATALHRPLLAPSSGMAGSVLDAPLHGTALQSAPLEGPLEAAVVQEAAIRARLHRAMLLLPAADPATLRQLPGNRVLTAVLARPDQPWRRELEGIDHAVVTVTPPDAARRAILWRTQLRRYRIEPDAHELTSVATLFALGPTQIANAAAAVSRDGVRPLVAHARDQSQAMLPTLAQALDPGYGWADLVLPEPTLRRLREFASAIRHRHQVFDAWGFRRRAGGVASIRALFSGASGTGKTMAAAVVAADLGLPLWRVDLSAVVSKYIGETEKNLEEVFRAAESSNALLMFDEADALFGKRSEVTDARDRYANIEVAYLLQRLETFEGTLVLATNLAANLDPAFARRLQLVVEFPLPDVTARERLWRHALPAEVPVRDVLDVGTLARMFPLSGGEIGNIALGAAFLASAAHTPIGMDEVVRSVARHRLRQGKLPGAAEFGPFLHLARAEGAGG